MTQPRAAHLLVGSALVAIGASTCHARPPAATAPHSASGGDLDYGTQALAACRKLFGPAAGLADGVDATAAAGEFLVCTISGSTSAEKSWRLETVVLAQVEGSNVHYVEIDRGHTGALGTCENYSREADDDDVYTKEASASVRVSRSSLVEGQIIYRVDWMEDGSSCEAIRDWYATKRSAVWVRNSLSTRQVAGCAWELDPYDDGMVDCEIGISDEPGGIVIMVEESSRALNPDGIPRQVVTTRRYAQRGHAYVLETTETKTSEP